MALVKCNECGKEISENAVSCPNCGAKNKNNNETASTGLKVICFLIPLIGIIIFAINISTRPKYAKGCLIASLLPTILLLIIIPILIGSVMTTGESGILSKSTSDYKNTNSNSSLSSSTETSDYCYETGCTNKKASGSIYCYTHKSSASSNSSYLPYCQYYGCTNRVSYSWKDYCTRHSYMED